MHDPEPVQSGAVTVARDVAAMHSITGHALTKIRDPMQPRDTQPQLVVDHHRRKVLVEETNLVERRTSNQNARHHELVLDEHGRPYRPVASQIANRADDATRAIDHRSIGAYEHATRSALDRVELSRELVAIDPHVVAVEKGDERRAARPDAAIARSRDSHVAFVAKVVNAMVPGMACDDGRGVVGRSVIDNDDFEIADRLRDHAVDGLRQEQGAIERGDDDADAIGHRRSL